MYATFLFDPSQLSLVSPTPVVMVAQKNQGHGQAHQDDKSSPLTIARCFEQLATQTRHRMLVSGAKQLDVPARFAQRHSNNGKFQLIAEAWQIARGPFQAELRMVKIDGGKSNIVNTWIFPDNPLHYPVFAAELIGVGDAVRVAFLDIQAPVQSARSGRLSDEVKSVASKFVHLPCDESAPDWAIDASLGYYTYARNVPESQLADLRAGYLAYLDLFINYAGSLDAPRPVRSGLHSAIEQLHVYQLHHMQHSPGKKFLGNLFGMDWTERFMLDFLFTKP